jgi:hypothetical protein
VDATAERTGPLTRFQIRHLFPVIVVGLLMPLAAAGPIGDNSFLWHVRAGSAQWHLGHVLTTDSFSYTMVGSSWRTQSWLAELGYAGLEAVTGSVAWAPLLVTIVCLLALVFIGLSVYSTVRSTLSVALWLFVAVWLFAPFAHPRPVVFSYLLLAVLVVVVRLGDRVGWAAVPIVWVWAAVHGSWMLGVGLLVLEAIRRRSWRMASLAGLSLVAATLTAHGVGVWTILTDFLSHRDALAYLGEWGRPDLLDIVQGPYLLIVGAVVVALIRRRIPINDLWVVLPFLVAGFTTERTVVPAAIVALPYAARAFDVRMPDSARRSSLIPWLVAALVVVLGIALLLRPGPVLSEERFPSDALLSAVTADRFFHDDAVGGYLVYRDWPGRQVYIDDRAELYGADMFQGLRDVKAGEYQAVFDRWDMTEAIVKPDWKLGERLIQDGWQVVYQDEFFALYRAPAG